MERSKGERKDMFMKIWYPRLFVLFFVYSLLVDGDERKLKKKTTEIVARKKENPIEAIALREQTFG